MEIIIRDINREFITECINSHINAECSDIFSYPCDALVSPANSFGFMDGGIDYVYLKRWPHIQETVQEEIKKVGELLVGQSLSVRTGDKDFPILIVSPTMRVPRPIINYDDVYLSTISAIRCANNMGVNKLVIPGMGTLSGRVPLHVAAIMMKRAIEDYKLCPNDYFLKNKWQ